MVTSLYGSAPCLFSWYSVNWFRCKYTFLLYFKSVSKDALTLYSAPTSGGQYHWVSILAPQNSQKLLSYISGMSCLGLYKSVAAS
jgi:hypothetical protein